MDPRVDEHAAVLVEWSARVDPGDNVVVGVSEGAHELAVAVNTHLGRIGANPVVTYESDEVLRAFLQAAETFEPDPPHEAALLQEADVYLALRGGRNTTALADVPSDRRQAHARSREGVREARFATDWVATIHPTRSLAQQAGMAFEEYRDFAYAAMLRDWESLAEEMAVVKELLDDGGMVHVEGPGTDLSMAIEDRIAINSAASVAYDSHNLPSGEVFTAPVSADGEITFDVPMTINDRRVRDVWLEFQDGVVSDYDASEGAVAIEETLGTDDGAGRIGEFGVGMNRGIDRATDSILFDEKMAGTIHVALGRAYNGCLPAGVTGNQSAVHVDLITRMGERSRISVDGEVVQRNGVFRWEDGFEQ